MTRGLAIEYAKTGVRVNNIAPTPMHPEAIHGALATLHLMGRMGEVSEIDLREVVVVGRPGQTALYTHSA